VNEGLVVVAHHNLLPRWLPPRRLGKRLGLASVEIRLEVSAHNVFPGRDIAEGNTAVFLQRAADMIRQRVAIHAIHIDSAAVLVRKLGSVGRNHADVNGVERLPKGRELYVWQSDPRLDVQLDGFLAEINARIEGYITGIVMKIVTFSREQIPSWLGMFDAEVASVGASVGIGCGVGRKTVVAQFPEFDTRPLQRLAVWLQHETTN